MSCGCSDSTLSTTGCCCSQECLPPEPSQGQKGDPGSPGSTGAAGADGINAFTVTTNTWTVPAVGNNVAIPVASGTWAAPGQPIFLQDAGEYECVTSSALSITAKNLGGSNNAAPATVIATNRQVSPSGTVGTLVDPLPIASGGTGQATAIAGFGALSPLTTTGDVLSYSVGANVRIAAGTSGQVLTANGAAVPSWQTNAPAAANITGQVAITNGGTSANTAAGARTALGTPQLVGSNAFSGGSNTFDVGTGTFRVTKSSVAVILCSSSFLALYDFVGLDALNWNNRHLIGQWAQSKKAFVTANASTYTVPSTSAVSNVETVISTYSLTGAQAITLPAGTDGRVVRIVDGGGNAAVNPITISRAGADTVLGGTTYTINNSYGSIALIFMAATTNWVPLP